MREKGNDAVFARGTPHQGAEETYEQGASLFTYMNAESPLDPSYAAQNLESCEAAVPLYNNLALCLQRRRCVEKVCAEACTEAGPAPRRPQSHAGFYRRGSRRARPVGRGRGRPETRARARPVPTRRATPSRARAAIAAARLQDAEDKRVLAGCFDSGRDVDDATFAVLRHGGGGHGSGAQRAGYPIMITASSGGGPARRPPEKATRRGERRRR